jgi:hypothetical protein
MTNVNPLRLFGACRARKAIKQERDSETHISAREYRVILQDFLFASVFMRFTASQKPSRNHAK